MLNLKGTNGYKGYIECGYAYTAYDVYDITDKARLLIRARATIDGEDWEEMLNRYEQPCKVINDYDMYLDTIIKFLNSHDTVEVDETIYIKEFKIPEKKEEQK